VAFHIPARFLRRFLTAHYAFAALTVAAAVGLRLALDPVVGSQAPYLTFFIAVLIRRGWEGSDPA